MRNAPSEMHQPDHRVEDRCHVMDASIWRRRAKRGGDAIEATKRLHLLER